MPADVVDLELSGFRLPDNSPDMQRRLVGNAEYHDAQFLRQYDFTTLFYDCFRDSDTGQVHLLGPPLFNLKRLLKETDFSVDGRPASIAEIQDLSRCSIVKFDVAQGQALSFQHRLSGGTVPIGRSCVHDFQGLNAIYTISRNNRLEWIADWLDYYVRVHGAEAVVFADNGSTAYSPSDLRDTLGAVPGLKKATILRARYPFGPTVPNKAGYAALFLQRSLSELGRRRFLARAGAVLNADIDELFHSFSGQSVFDAAKASVSGYLRGDAVWVYAPRPGSDGYARHRDHTHVSASGKPKANRKWCVVPGGPQKGRQWLTHFLGSSDDPVDPDFLVWHFHQVSTAWKYDRTTIREDLVEDPVLVEAMEKVFRTR
jgi:hypothetical protein